MKQIINSLLDNDLYKFTMLQAFCYYEEDTEAQYTFLCRTPNIDFTDCLEEIDKQIDALCRLKFSADELEYLEGLEYIRPDFIFKLKDFQLKRKYIKVKLLEDGALDINIKGPISEVSLFEIPVLSIINEIYFESKISKTKAWRIGPRRLNKKLKQLIKSDKKISFAEFGTRRRYSFEWQENVIKSIIDSEYKHFLGTSNVYFAKKYNLTPIGTMAHEWIMAHAGVFSMEDSTRIALKRWLEFYEEKLGIALTDTYTTEYFLSQFNKKMSNGFTGLRQDSGSWKIWGYKILDHYKKYNIDPLTKTFIFSDGLNFNTVNDIYDEFADKVNLMFGIGTDLTNDVGVNPIQIVIKMIEANDNPVIKVSDSPGKIICADEKYKSKVIKILKKLKMAG